MMFKSKYCSRKQSQENDCTRDAIFLFQRARWICVDLPDGYAAGDDGVVARAGEDGEVLYDEESGTYVDELTMEDLSEISSGAGYSNCAEKIWETEMVFLTREEANEYGERRSYNYPDGWRSYSVPAEGELAVLLKMTELAKPALFLNLSFGGGAPPAN